MAPVEITFIKTVHRHFVKSRSSDLRPLEVFQNSFESGSYTITYKRVWMETGFKDCILTVLGDFFSLLSTVEVKSSVWKVLKKIKFLLTISSVV